MAPLCIRAQRCCQVLAAVAFSRGRGGLLQNSRRAFEATGDRAWVTLESTRRRWRRRTRSSRSCTWKSSSSSAARASSASRGRPSRSRRTSSRSRRRSRPWRRRSGAREDTAPQSAHLRRERRREMGSELCAVPHSAGRAPRSRSGDRDARWSRTGVRPRVHPEGVTRSTTSPSSGPFRGAGQWSLGHAVGSGGTLFRVRRMWGATRSSSAPATWPRRPVARPEPAVLAGWGAMGAAGPPSHGAVAAPGSRACPCSCSPSARCLKFHPPHAGSGCPPTRSPRPRCSSDRTGAQSPRRPDNARVERVIPHRQSGVPGPWPARATGSAGLVGPGDTEGRAHARHEY